MKPDLSKYNNVLLVTGNQNTKKKKEIKKLKSQINSNGNGKITEVKKIKGETKQQVKNNQFDLILGFNSHSNLVELKSSLYK